MLVAGLRELGALLQRVELDEVVRERVCSGLLEAQLVTLEERHLRHDLAVEHRLRRHPL